MTQGKIFPESTVAETMGKYKGLLNEKKVNELTGKMEKLGLI